jgi:hypothetical protein
MYDKNYYDEQRKELQQEALKIKLRHSDKSFQLAIELDQDIQAINGKMAKINAKEQESIKADKVKEVKPEVLPKKK